MESLTEIDAEDLQAFLIESHEILSQVEQDILSLEKGSFDQQKLDQIYRALHTIKGNCGFLPFPKLETIAHAGETVLETLRTTQREVAPAIATALLQLTDAIRQTLQAIENTATEGNQDYATLVATLTSLSTAEPIPSPPAFPPLDASPNGFIPSPSSSTVLASPDTQPAAIPGSTADSTQDSVIWVQVDLLDHVIDLVGELVLARNRMLQLAATRDDPTLIATCRQIDLVTSELQEGVMRTRMQPISTLWRNLPRLVRETAIACGKEVALILEGGETELDRSLLAVVKDPLTHIVRNCIDHGIEAPAARTAMGKAAQGTLKVRAFQASGKVIVEISDDGAGIDLARVKVRSQQLGLINASQAEGMSNREALALIFRPGFSTATEVTHLSGRGVGMDVVRRNLESVNGSVEVESRLGQGTTFRLNVPLTLAIIPALLVACGGERFAIPQASVQELIRIEGAEQIASRIETLLDVPIYRLRGQILPLVNLATVLKLTPAATPDLLYFVVIALDGYRFGLVVDQIEDTQDIVVKPLSQQLRSLKMFAGVTILGDGSTSLILSMAGLAAHAGIQPQVPATLTTADLDNSNQHLILIVLMPQGLRVGICLDHDTRLEMIPATMIEQVGEQSMMKYRDRIVKVIDLQTVLTGEPYPLAQREELIPLVVIMLAEDRTIGLIVHNILDIVEDSLTVTGAASRPGVQCYATIQGQITEILDLEAVVELANPYRPSPDLTLEPVDSL